MRLLCAWAWYCKNGNILEVKVLICSLEHVSVLLGVRGGSGERKLSGSESRRVELVIVRVRSV